LAALDRALDVLLHPRRVLRVDARGPRVDERADLGRVVAEHAAEVVVPPKLVGEEVPVPDHVVGGARDDLEALQALLQALLGLEARGDVAAGAAIAAEDAGLVEHRLAAHGNIAPVSAGQPHGVLEVAERLAPRQGLAVDSPFRAAGVDGRDLPAALAEQRLRIDREAREEAAINAREAQLLVLLPIPVARQLGEVAEALLALAQL